jgi:DNA-binding CsgD family transcriptional regulator
VRHVVEARVAFVVCDAAPAIVATELLHLLTPAQRAIALRTARGESLPRIAKALGISYATARVHLRDVYRRVGVHDRADLRARLAQR